MISEGWIILMKLSHSHKLQCVGWLKITFNSFSHRDITSFTFEKSVLQFHLLKWPFLKKEKEESVTKREQNIEVNAHILKKVSFNTKRKSKLRNNEAIAICYWNKIPNKNKIFWVRFLSPRVVSELCFLCNAVSRLFLHNFFSLRWEEKINLFNSLEHWKLRRWN